MVDIVINGVTRTATQAEIDASVLVDAPVTADDVKAEAQRRILQILPEWQQRNLTAQATVLAEKGRANWSAEELAAWSAGEAIWGVIQGIRAASDLIEATPGGIPVNFRANEYWP